MKFRVGVRRDPELVRLGAHRRVVRQPEAELALGEGRVERVRRQIECGRAERQELAAERVDGVGIGEHRLAKTGQVRRPPVGPREAAAGAHERIVRPALALDEERLVQVGLVVGVDVGRPHRVPPEHHVAVVVFVHPERQLGLHGLGVEAARLGERVVDQRLRDPVVDDDEEADVLERAAELGRGGRPRTGPSGEIGAQVDHRNHRG
jgi:hypothetical protein